MLEIIPILLIAALIGYYEIPSLLKKHLKRDLYIFLSLLIISTGFSILYALNIKIPNPLDGLTKIYKPINDLFEKL